MVGSGRIDILVLRDAANVGRYNLPVWLARLLVLTPAVLVLLLAAAVAVAYHLHRDNTALTERGAALRLELDAAGEGLLRLANLEKVLRGKDPTELKTLVGSYNPDNPGWWKSHFAAGQDAGPAQAEGRERPDLSRLLARVDANQVVVDNLRIKFDNRRLNLGFDLGSAGHQAVLSGRLELGLVGNDGGFLPLKCEKDELSFQIQRTKPVSLSLALPAKIEPRDLYGLRLVVVDGAGKPVFAQVYPTGKE